MEQEGMMDQEEIMVVCGSRIGEMTYELLRRSGLSELIRERFRDKDPLIALKPNLLGPIPASLGATTHPEIAGSVIGYLREEGFGRIVVMESSWVGDRTSDSLLVTGFGELCDRLEVPFWDLQQDEAVPVDCAGMTLNICQRALEADFLINLPVMKGHCQTGMTCALKNMKGCIPGGEKRRFHRMGLHEPIGHLSAGIRQDFILADAICPDLNFEDGGNPVALNRLILARDPVLLDAFSLRQIGLEDGSVPYIRIAERSGVGSADLSKARITTLMEKTVQGECVYLESGGEWSSLPWHGERDRILKVKEMVCDVDSCSACYGTLIPVLHRLEEEGLASALPGQLCIGQGFRGRTGRIGIGNCTARFDTFLKGCPPDECQIEQFLRSLMT